MNLDTFISQSLAQILQGIQDAQSFTRENPSGAKVNPRGVTALEKDSGGQNQPHDLQTKLPVHQVDFDIAVTVTDSKEGEAGGKLSVVGIGVGGKAYTTGEHSSVSRISFSIPVIWPDPKTAKAEA